MAPTSHNQEIRVGDRQSGIELGELNGLAGGAAIAAVDAFRETVIVSAEIVPPIANLNYAGK